jgi:hypothetical protein
MYCSDCQFFKDDARCNLSKQDVGYFQKACSNFEPIVPAANAGKPLHIFSAKDYQPDPKQTPMEKEQATQTKVCSKCGRELPIENFTRGRYGPTSVCKECKAEIMRRNAKKKEDKVEIRVAEFDSKQGAVSMLGLVTDDQLMTELQAHGWSGTLSKTVKFELTPSNV